MPPSEDPTSSEPVQLRELNAEELIAYGEIQANIRNLTLRRVDGRVYAVLEVEGESIRIPLTRSQD